MVCRNEKGREHKNHNKKTNTNLNMAKSESSDSKRRRRSKRDDDDIVVNDTASLVDDSELFVVDTAPTGVDDEKDTESTKEQLAGDVDEGCGSKDNNDDDEGKDETTKRKRKRNRKKKSSGDDGGENTGGSSADAASAKKQQLLSSVEHTVFIEGLPFTSTSEQVRHFFEVHGCKDIIDMRLPTWQDSGRLRGFGHVVFASAETRARALSDDVNGKELGGRYVTVREANAPRAGTTMGASTSTATRDQPKGCKTVFVRNLPYDALEDDILESFRIFGKIIEGGVRVARNHVTATSKGFGYVEFKNEEGALAAVQKAAKPFGLLVKQRPVFVDYDEGTVKGSFRDGDGKLWNKEHNKGGSGTVSSGGRGGRGGGRGGFSSGRGGFGGRGSGTSFGGARSR